MLYIIGFLIFCLISGVAIAASPLNDPDFDPKTMVEALRLVENWDGHSRGAAEERGPWQITPGFWVMYSREPFRMAEGDSKEASAELHRVVLRAVESISYQLQYARLPRNAFSVALVWAAGWSSYFYHRPHKPTKAKRIYAHHAENLYYDLLKAHTHEKTNRP